MLDWRTAVPRTLALALAVRVLAGCYSPPPEARWEGSGVLGPWPGSVRAEATPPIRTQETRTVAPLSPSQPTQTTGQGAGSLVIEKSAPAQAVLGRDVEWTITVRNVADYPIEEVTITDELPSTMRYKSADPQAEVAGGSKLRWVIPMMNGRTTQTFKVRCTATALGEVVNCCYATYRVPACASMTVIEPKLSLVKTAPAQALICDPIPLAFVVQNPTAGVATNVVVSDSLPDGWTTTEGRTQLTFVADTLGPGESREFTASVKAGKTGDFTNTATATSDEGAKAAAHSATTVVRPVLSIEKLGKGKTYLGRSVVYLVRVKNTGDGVARDTVVEDALPAGMSFVSADNDGAAGEGKVTWRLGDLAPGATKDLGLTLQAQSAGAGRNVATAVAYCAESVSASVDAETAGVPAVLLEVVDLEDPILVGSDVTYEITATNQGSATDSNIVMVVELEDEARYVSAEGSATVPTAEGQKITFAPLPTLAAKQEAVWKVVVKALKAGDVRFRCTMTTHQTTRPIEETEATRFYEP